MPTYEYMCRDCGTTTELMQPMSAKPKRRLGCLKCGAVTRCRRLIGSGACVLFKGSGFYQTDYRSKSYKKGVKDAESAEARGGGKGLSGKKPAP